MGLTIHYSLHTSLDKTEDIRLLVETLRQHALDLPFLEVAEIVEFQGRDADYDHTEKDDRGRYAAAIRDDGRDGLHR